MRLAVVGSGPSGVAAASVLLAAGHRVDILDAGIKPGSEGRALAARVRSEVAGGLPVRNALLYELKHGPREPHQGLLAGLAAVLGRGVAADRGAKRILGSRFAFSGVEDGIPVAGARPPRSLARGGLSNVWGAACYPLRAADYACWPVSAEEMAPYYRAAADLLGLIQCRDDLERAYPIHGPAADETPRNPDSAAERLLRRWRRHRDALARHGIATGRTRLAVRPHGVGGNACRRCALCFYGCAYDAIYTSRRTLEELTGREGFRYRSGLLVSSFRDDGSAVSVRCREVGSGAEWRRTYEALFLAAGTLSSLRVAADSLELHGRPAPLLDNDMFLLPIIQHRDRVGGGFQTAFTLGEAVLAIDPGVVAERALHLQIYSFNEYFLAELSELLAAAPGLARRVAWGQLNNLLVAFVYLSGRDSVIANARVLPGAEIGTVHIEQRPNPRGRAIQRRLFRHLRAGRRELGWIPARPLMKATPIGFSGHLAGTLPMRREPGELETSPDGLLAGTKRVYVVDSATFPELPAQNLTFTTVANAMRIASAFARRAASFLHLPGQVVRPFDENK